MTVISYANNEYNPPNTAGAKKTIGKLWYVRTRGTTNMEQNLGTTSCPGYFLTFVSANWPSVLMMVQQLDTVYFCEKTFPKF